MSLSSKGEGGIVVLKEILSGYVKKGRALSVIAFMSYIGVSLLMGDGVITPAISILSAIEGLQFIPGFSHIGTNEIVIITLIITILLFMVQSKGTDKVASSFGPIMVIWFSTLFISGISSLVHNPKVLFAISPHYALDFMLHNGFTGFIVLSEVILCATGGEALYADMGHLGRKPIKTAWYFVFVALVINYFGQGAFVLSLKQGEVTKLNVLFGMVKSQQEILYIPFLILTLMATIIASQAMISAVFSLVYQGIRTHIFPLFRVSYTSSHLKSQIYINSVNWGLLIAVMFMILLFKESKNLAAAYGFAVTATMALSTVFMIWIFLKQKNIPKLLLALFVFVVNINFLIAVFTKLPHGGYWSIVVGAIPFFTIYIWIKGNKVVFKSFRSLPIDTYLVSYEQIYNSGKILPGTALFFTKS
jgi:KUP system potassium uptake protein